MIIPPKLSLFELSRADDTEPDVSLRFRPPNSLSATHVFEQREYMERTISHLSIATLTSQRTRESPKLVIKQLTRCGHCDWQWAKIASEDEERERS